MPRVKKTSEPVAPEIRQDINISIRPVKNGYIVNAYNGRKDETFVFKTKSEARIKASKLLK